MLSLALHRLSLMLFLSMLLLSFCGTSLAEITPHAGLESDAENRAAVYGEGDTIAARDELPLFYFYDDALRKDLVFGEVASPEDKTPTSRQKSSGKTDDELASGKHRIVQTSVENPREYLPLDRRRSLKRRLTERRRLWGPWFDKGEVERRLEDDGLIDFEKERAALELPRGVQAEQTQAQDPAAAGTKSDWPAVRLPQYANVTTMIAAATGTVAATATSTQIHQLVQDSTTPKQQEDHNVALVICGSAEKRFYNIRGRRIVDYEQMWSVAARVKRYLLDASLYAVKRVFVFLCGWPDLEVVERSGEKTGPRSEAGQSRSSNREVRVVSASRGEVMYWRKHLTSPAKHDLNGSARTDTATERRGPPVTIVRFLRGGWRNYGDIHAVLKSHSPEQGKPIEFAELRRRVDLGTFAGQFEHLDMCFRGVRQFEQLQRDSQRDSEASQQLFRFSYFIRLRPDIILYDDFPRVDLFPRDRVALRAVNVVSNNPGLFEDATPLLRRQYCNPTRESDLGEEHSCRVPKYFSRQYAKTEAAYDDSLEDAGGTGGTGGTHRRTRFRRPQIRTTESALQDYREYLDYHNVPLCSGLDDQVFVAHTNVADAVFLDGRWDRAYGRDFRRYSKRVETVADNAGRMLESRKVSSAAFRKGHWPLLKLEWEGYWERDGTDFFSRGVAVDESGGGGRLRLVGQKETAVGGATRSAGLASDMGSGRGAEKTTWQLEVKLPLYGGATSRADSAVAPSSQPVVSTSTTLTFAFLPPPNGGRQTPGETETRSETAAALRIHANETLNIASAAPPTPRDYAAFLHPLDPRRKMLSYRTGARQNPDFFVRDWNRTAFATSESAIQAFFGRNGGHFAMEKCEPYILPTGIYMRKRDRVLRSLSLQRGGGGGRQEARSSSAAMGGGTAAASGNSTKRVVSSTTAPADASPVPSTASTARTAAAAARPLRLPSPSRLSFAEQVYDEMNPLGFNDNESVFTIRMYARQVPAIIVPISASLISFTNRGRAFQTPELVGGNGSGNTGAGAVVAGEIMRKSSGGGGDERGTTKADTPETINSSEVVLPPAENILDDLQWKDAGGFGGISPGLRRRMGVLATFGKDTAVAKAEERMGATDGGVAAVVPSSAEDQAEHRPVVVVITYCPADADYDRFEEEKKGNATIGSLADVIADPLCRALYAEKMQQMGELGPRPAMRRISKLTGGIKVPRGAEL